MKIEPAASWPWIRRAHLAVFTAAGAFLAWMIVRHTLAAHLATVAPETALLLNPRQPTALIESAERQMRAELSRIIDARSKATSGDSRGRPMSRFAFQNPDSAIAPAEGVPVEPRQSNGQPDWPATNKAVDPIVREAREQIGKFAASALHVAPLNARAYRVLALLAELEGDMSRQSKLMRTAATLSLRDVVAVLWAMQDSFQRKDYAATLKYADAMFRTQPELEAYFVPFLTRLAEIREARPGLVALLGQNPPWRDTFLTSLPRSVTDTRSPFDLLTQLKTTPAPPTSKEVANYLRFLVQRNLHELAYYTWLQFLPAEQLARAGHLNNGSFEHGLTRSPFDWEINAGSGVRVDIQPRPDNFQQRALHIEFNHGRVEFGAVHQLTLLTPGKYSFAGMRQGSLFGRRGLQWRVLCTGDGRQIGAGKMDLGIFPKWQLFSFDFTVPASNCKTQSVTLVLAARSTSERLVTGSIYYDELEIKRVTLD